MFEARLLRADPDMQPTRLYTRRAQPGAFVAWGARLAPDPSPPPAGADDAASATIPSDAIIDGSAREAAAHAAGLEEGYALALMELAEEKAALGRLVASLDALAPEPPQALALLLAETVGRLVRQVVGEVDVDTALLARRAEAVAAMVIDEVAPCRLKMHPDDAARIGALPDIHIAPDPALAAGMVQLDCGDGWIEDGPDGALERLHLALDRMGAPR